MLKTIESVEQLTVEEEIGEALECLHFVHPDQEHEGDVGHSLDVAHFGAGDLDDGKRGEREEAKRQK